MKMTRWTALLLSAVVLVSPMLPGSIVMAYEKMNAPNAYYHGPRDGKKRIALTFDDGPHPSFTGKILDVLAEYHVHATFFMIGENLDYYGAIAPRVAQEGHEIGVHTYHHECIRKMSKAALAEDLRKTEQKIREITGAAPHLIRPPQGACSRENCDAAAAAGYSVIFWSIDTKDWAGNDADRIVSNTLKTIQSGDIMLFHDYVCCHNTTIAALRQLIPALQKQGYTLCTVSELLGIPSEVQ